MAEYPVKRRPARAPTHPGEVLREDVLPAMRLSVSAAARDLRVSRQTLHAILSAKAAVTPDMAVRLGKFCGNGPGLWLRMQQARDLWEAEQRLAREMKRIPTRPAAWRLPTMPAPESPIVSGPRVPLNFLSAASYRLRLL